MTIDALITILALIAGLAGATITLRRKPQLINGIVWSPKMLFTNLDSLDIRLLTLSAVSFGGLMIAIVVKYW
jgi:hypothetical protein